MDHHSEDIAHEDERSSAHNSCSLRSSQVLLSKGISTHGNVQTSDSNASQGSCDAFSATDVNTLISASISKSKKSVPTYEVQETQQLYIFYSLRNPITIVNM